MFPGWRSRRHASCSSAGRRAVNEDRAAAVRLARDTYVIAVADGMGGTAAGEVASAVAMDSFLTTMRASAAANVRVALRDAFSAADAAVREAAIAGREGMGTTLTAAVVRGPDVWVGNVGDSRAVLILPDEVVPLSRDHSLVAEAVRSGRMTELEALQSHERHVVSRALGDGDAMPEIKYHSLRGHDHGKRATLVAGTDGLFNFIGETELLEISGEDTGGRELVEQLVRRAIENGSDDNVSAAAIQVDAGPERRSRGLLMVLIAAVILAAAAAAWPPLHRSIGRSASARRSPVAADATDVRIVRLRAGGHLRPGAHGRLCAAEGRCFATWRVLRVEDATVVLEIRTTPSATPRAGGTR